MRTAVVVHGVTADGLVRPAIWPLSARMRLKHGKLAHGLLGTVEIMDKISSEFDGTHCVPSAHKVMKTDMISCYVIRRHITIIAAPAGLPR